MKENKGFCFTETPEQKVQMDAVLEQYGGDESNLLVVLQEAQKIYGYLPIEVQKKVADGMGVSMEKVYGVVTFYSFLRTDPVGKYNFSVCMGTVCYVKGAGLINEKLKEVLGIDDGQCTPDGLFAIAPTRCIGCCGLAPVMFVNDDVYGNITHNDVEDIVEIYRKRAKNL